MEKYAILFGMKRISRMLVLCLMPVIASAQFHNKGEGQTTISRSPTRIEVNGKAVEFNTCSSDKTEIVFLTHARRDVVERVRKNAGPNLRVIAPEASRDFLENAEEHWRDWWEARFNYYGQQVTKRPIHSLPATQYVKEGDKIEWEGHSFEVIETPGYTRDGVSYLVKAGPSHPPLGAKDIIKTAFDEWIVVGHLINASGQVPDLYSFQDAIPEAKIGSYHGYGARFATWISSLEKLKRKDPEGRPLAFVSTHPYTHCATPTETIDAAIKRMRNIYGHFLETNALHWYFGEERMGAAAKRTLGEGHEMKPLFEKMAEHVDLPNWCQHIGTTKLLVSDDGFGFALDVGGKNQFESIQKALDDGLIKKLEGIWVTHTHNDHTAFVAEAARKFDCPVYAVDEVADVLVHPGRWFLPGTSPNAIDAERMKIMPNGETVKWRGFQFISHFFPGQMYNHGALLVEKPDNKPVYFVGDAFSPTGIDDYCLMNRNLMREDSGYALCFKKIRNLPEGTWLVNQHIPHLFKFSPAELSKLQTSYGERRELIEQMTSWDDVNYAIDEEWAWFYPYGQDAKRGEKVKVTMRIWNHSEKGRTFKLALHDADGLTISEKEKAITLNGRETGEVTFSIEISDDAAQKVHVITADIESDPGIKLEHWCEALIRVQ